MATLLEQTRLAHEEVERLERLIVEELSREARTHRERLAQGHRVAAMVDRISARAGKLVRVHAVAVASVVCAAGGALPRRRSRSLRGAARG